MQSPSVGDGFAVRVRALNVAFRITCHGSGAQLLDEAVTRAWDWCLSTGDDDEAVTGPVIDLSLLLEDEPEALALNAGGHDLFAADLGTMMDRLSPLITRLAVGRQAGRLLMLHACALADPATGNTAILFGPSGTGKTTLARTLGGQFAYLTDETAAVDGDLRMVAYPKPLSIIVTPGDLLKQQVSAGELGLRQSHAQPAAVRAVIQLDRQPHLGDEVVVERLHTVDALPELVTQTSYSAAMPRPLHRLAALAHSVDGVRRVSYGESRRLAPVISELLATGAA